MGRAAMKTQAEIEAVIRDGVTHSEQDDMGRGVTVELTRLA
jgi:hypothetical protein